MGWEEEKGTAGDSGFEGHLRGSGQMVVWEDASAPPKGLRGESKPGPPCYIDSMNT